MDEQATATLDTPIDLFNEVKSVLEANDQGTYTVPSPGLYPHQWLWDSCFIAIGQRHYDVDRAQQEILSLLRGQWSNGMLPNMIMNIDRAYRRDRDVWRSWVNPHSSDKVITSGITQPPMVAEAVVRVGEKLKLAERRHWYRMVFPALVEYHQWLYKDRDPHGEGLVLLVHPWECGMDNTPPWMSELHEHQLPGWIRFIKWAHLDGIVNLLRRDVHFVSVKQRLSTIDALAFYSTQRRLRRKGYDIDKVLTHSMFSIEDLGFNCILIRANTHLQAIAKSLRQDLPEELVSRMHKTEQALNALWDPYSNQYYSRNFVTHKLLKEPSIATLLPLYAGCISEERAQILVKMLENARLFGPPYPVPTVPVNSGWYHPTNYWQGPTWININWLLIDGLRRYGFNDHADALRESTLELVQRSGCHEYFNPETGEPAGAANFSWTAALTLDLLKR